MIRILVLILIVAGCSTKKEKAWLSIEKSPMRIIYVTKPDEINTTLVDHLVKTISKVPYRKEGFNENTNIGMNVVLDHSVSDTKVREINIKKD